MSDPFRIEGPALISFSGGRTSAYMLWRILRAHGGTLPDDVKVTFANTGKEMPETLDFVRDCGDHWGVEIIWLEYRRVDGKHTFARVDHVLASRAGEPFTALIESRAMLPNPVMRFCTVELKIRTMARYAKSIGWDEFDKVVGLRADEAGRVAKMRARAISSKETGERDIHLPLAVAGITKADIVAFWSNSNFDLRLQNVNGVTPEGNCDFCFLKGAATIMGIMRRRGTESARWWADTEARKVGVESPRAAFFRADRPSYAKIMAAVDRSPGFDFGAADELNDCACTD